MEKFINIINKDSNIDEIINNLPVFEKGWKLNTIDFEEPWYYEDFYCNAENASKAKSKFLSKYKYDLPDELLNGEKINFLNLKVLRDNEVDKFEIILKNEIQILTRFRLKSELEELKRLSILNEIINNNSIKYVFINKNGNYYGENSKGYFSKVDFELIGIYDKKDVYEHACSVREIILEPITIEEYNKIINEKIEFYYDKIKYLKNKILKNG